MGNRRSQHGASTVLQLCITKAPYPTVTNRIGSLTGSVLSKLEMDTATSDRHAKLERRVATVWGRQEEDLVTGVRRRVGHAIYTAIYTGLGLGLGPVAAALGWQRPPAQG